MPIVSTLPLLPLGSQPTAQKFENKFSYALGSPPINTRTQAPHVNPHPDNNLHILLNIGLKQKVEFCKRKIMGYNMMVCLLQTTVVNFASLGI